MNYIKVLDDIFRQFSGPRFSITFWNNETKTYGTGNESVFTLRFENPEVVRRLLTEGALGFGESYMDGSLKIDGDIDAYLKTRHQFKHIRPSWRLVLAKFFAHLKTPAERTEQIAHHYDLGNDFFQLFLDKETMSYSAGRYRSPNMTLGEAQIEKLGLVADWLSLTQESDVLDLGCGWGGFAEYAATKRNWDVTGYTLSKKQLVHCEEMRDRLKEHVPFFEYRDVSKDLPSAEYDGAVMIEAIEHIGKAHLESYFKNVKTVLKPNAPFYLQFTGRYEPRQVDSWTLKYVFPGGHLPAKAEFLDAATKAGFIVEKFEDHTEDYKKTMTAWIFALEEHEVTIKEMYGDSFFRLWKLWMHGAHVNFDIGAMSLFRALLRNGA